MIVGNKGCADCRFRMTEDYGSSTWTVMGTTHTCLKALNPAMPFDDDLSNEAIDRAMNFGITCTGRVEGDGPNFDVDGEPSVEAACGGDEELVALVRAARDKSP